MADSWEDEEERLAQQAQNLNINNAQARSFQPGASAFTPGAQAFTPGGQQQYPQYGGGYGQQQYQQYYNQQQAYGGYPQYGAQQGYPQYNQYGQQYPQQGYQNQSQYGQQQQGFQPQQPQPHQAPVQIAKRPAAGDNTSQAAASLAAAEPKKEAPKAKVLSIGGDAAPKAKVLSISAEAAAPKVEKTGGTKVLSLGSTAPAPSAAKDNVDKKAPEAGSKVAAAKAIEKTGEDTKAGSASGTTSPTPSSGRNSPSRSEAATRGPTRTADVIEQEQAEDVDEDTLAEMYGKEHVNVIFLGHVDAGKSTLGGSILYATGMVDERTMDKYKREAKEAGRETWYLSWALDLTKEERSKGKTVEVGRAFFETEKRRYTILDAPGHKTFVPSMIGGASQADVGILVISARKGEYETGFEKGGQTREHAMLAKTQGVNKLVVAVNKMDDPTVEWSEERYKECTGKLSVFLKGVGYNPKTDLAFMPISAQTTVGIKDRVPKDLAPWHHGPSLLEYLDGMVSLERKLNAPFMMPIAAKYRDMGTMIEGKIESGVIKKENKYLMMPNRDNISISALYGEQEDEIPGAACGDQIRIRLRGVEEEDILPGFVLCSPKRPVHCVSSFEAQIVLLEIKSILSAGFNCVLHVHAAQEEVTFAALLHKLEKGTGRKSRKAPGFATKGMSIIARLEVTGAAGAICVERFEDYPQLGRFTLRDQGQTIAIGKITKLLTDEAA
ncbi:P-loop containing nucleoside triphosphate hydrolase protein [Massariosphaeria phaeospora]|uniref:Elongation factor 1-alpha n=1 Tax=Massariosphaeria phaeospora TaxID=100035 RepID=A0A7C8IC25_9PLEO|nr:P-loop containing nucleoside triphosphate hydrolase protein [Massariosphaeria phaeospora]